MAAIEESIDVEETEGTVNCDFELSRADTRRAAAYDADTGAGIIEIQAHQEPRDAILCGGLFMSTSARRLLGNDITLTPPIQAVDRESALTAHRAASRLCNTSQTRAGIWDERGAAERQPDKTRLLEVIRNLNNSGVVATTGVGAGADDVQQLPFSGLSGGLSSLRASWVESADGVLDVPMTGLAQFGPWQMRERWEFAELRYVSIVQIPPKVETPKGGLP